MPSWKVMVAALIGSVVAVTTAATTAVARVPRPELSRETSVVVAARQPVVPVKPVATAAKAAPVRKWVSAKAGLNVRTTPTRIGNQPVAKLPYGTTVTVTGVVKGQDPYGTHQDRWYQIGRGRLVWGGGVSNAPPRAAHAAMVLQAKAAHKAKVVHHTKVHRVKVTHKVHRRVVRHTGSKASMTSAWRKVAMCESGGNPRAVNPAGYYGLFQFDLRTWRSVGGTGNPINASAAEQYRRAKMLYAKRGAAPWPRCGRYL